MRTRHFSFLLAALFGLVSSVPVWGQGVLIAPDHRLPRPFPRPQPQTLTYAIDQIAVQARIRDQVAEVQLSQTFQNTGSRQMEVQFVFPLPYDGAVQSLTLLVDGKELPAQLLPADEARRRYEEIVRRCKDPALLEWMGKGMFQTSVFPVPAGAKRTVTLEYDQLLRKDQDVTDFLVPLHNGRYTSGPIRKLTIRAAIESGLPIKNIYSPSHDITVTRSGKKNAVVTVERTNEIPRSDFRLFFDTKAGKLGTSVLSYRPSDQEDGYFLLLTTPQLESPSEQIAKNIVFVVDKSGSMSGEKIEQARGALKFVLNALREGDRFNVVAYDSSVESFQPKLVEYNDKTRQRAIGFVEGIYAGGGTNIHDALKTAMSHLEDTKRASYVLFLTDGLPTSGETNEAKIAQMARTSNAAGARVLTFGVGYDVNSRLLDRLSRDNHGASEYVRPNEDIEAYVSRVYQRIQAPVLTNVKVKFEFDSLAAEAGAPINRTYPAGEFDLFAGEQLVVLGRYRKAGRAKVVISGDVGGRTQSFDFPAELAARSTDDSFGFVESLWVIRRIGEIIDELDLHGRNQELIDELVKLATRHGILTPYTSFLADETTSPTADTSSTAYRENLQRTARDLGQLDEAAGRGGVAQRRGKQALKAAQNLSAPAAAGAPGYGGFGAEESAEGLSSPSETVRQVGQDVLYKRGRLVVTPETADLDVEADKDKIQVVERYSGDYFKLVAANTEQENRLLSNQLPDEELLIHLRGQTYLIK